MSRDELILEWENAKTQLGNWKAKEMELRLKLVESEFAHGLLELLCNGKKKICMICYKSHIAANVCWQGASFIWMIAGPVIGNYKGDFPFQLNEKCLPSLGPDHIHLNDIWQVCVEVDVRNAFF